MGSNPIGVIEECGVGEGAWWRVVVSGTQPRMGGGGDEHILNDRPKRLRLRANPQEHAAPAPGDAFARGVADGDRAALAVLMLAAYRGSVDDGGEGPEEAAAEVAKLYAGEWGRLDRASSEVVAREGGVVNATIVTEYEGQPMVAFCMTMPAWKRRGLARAGLLRVLERLRIAGHKQVDLAVTATNVPARGLYESLGFVEVVV